MTVVPNYGRDYKSKKAVMEAWNNNIDFKIEPAGQAINKQDADRYQGCYPITVRYAGLKKVLIIKE